MTRSIGTCNTMGTASTMTSIVDAMGLTLPGRVVDPGGRQRPSAHGLGLRRAHRRDDLGGSRSRRASSMRGASATALSPTWRSGGSTNAAVHLIAMARRAGVDL